MRRPALTARACGPARHRRGRPTLRRASSPILTGGDLAAAGIGPDATLRTGQRLLGRSFRFPNAIPEGAETACAMPASLVALVIAESRSEALDRRRPSNDYTPLPAVVTIQDALDTGDPERVCLEPGRSETDARRERRL